MANTISFNNFEISYETFGNGEEVLFAFHGYGRSASDFKILLPAFEEKFTIISFNLLYHQNSSLKAKIADSSFNEDDLKNLINIYLSARKINQFSLLAYSLGAKLALTSIELFPNQIKNIYLIAPDGLKISFWYKIASNTLLGRAIYKYIIQHPWPFYALAYLGKALKLMPDNVYKFMLSQMETLEQREKAYSVWVIYRKLKPNKKNIAKIINDNQINIQLFFGKYDKIIPASIGIKFAKLLKNKNALHIIDAGHNLINANLNSKLKQASS